ncbi:MAG: hypothetical protein JO019_00360, partial [Candidatus Kaiserbacteria bacterium]|nr:hypothetical protein [Candidatus Kaiserbacteria bacterium]
CAYFIMVPLDTAICEYGRRVGDPVTASVYRNVAFMATNVVLFGALLLVLKLFEASFALAIVSLITLALVNFAAALRGRR